jgi:outer membrane protein TolC
MTPDARTRRRARVALFAAVFACFGGPGAAFAANVPVSLDEALVLAETHNPDLAAARARVEAQHMRRAATARTAWPRLSLVLDLSRTDAPARVFAEKLGRGAFGSDDLALPRLNDPDGVGHLGSALALELPIDTAGTTRARVRSEEAAARAAELQLAEARLELRWRVTEAYARAALATAALAAHEQALAGARSREDVLAARASEGVVLAADLLRARARRRQREADLARARGEEQAALAVLAQALGDAGPERRPAGLPAVSEDDAGTLEEWLARAGSSHPLLDAAEQRRVALAWGRRVEERAAWPALSGYANAFDDRWSGASRRSYAVGAAVRWTLDPARPRRVAAARAEENAAVAEAAALQARVNTQVRAAWVRRAAAREEMGAAQGGTAEGHEALRVVRERRAAGLATLTDELETEAAALAAEIEELRARAEAVLADAALRRAAGEP